jgi:histidinol-phosphate aminotransferase
LTPYVPGEQPRHERLIKLNTNECPYPPSPRVLAAIAGVSGDQLRRYPDPGSGTLRSVIGDYYGLPNDQVFVGNGSDEVLAHLFQGLLRHEDPLLLPDISYSFYPVWCRLYNLEYRQVPLAADFSVRVADYSAQRGAIIIPNPNAPTGMALNLADVRELLDRNRDAVVVIDEAYVDYGARSAASLVPEYDNLVVVQTLSKSRALAGLRVGLALAQPHLIEGLNRVKDSFNSYPLDILAQRAAVAAFEDDAYFQRCRDQVIASRESLTAALQSLGFRVLPSQANFVFASHPEHSAGVLYERLRAEGIIVRHWDQERIADFLRISIGTEQECDILLRSLGDMLD